MLGQGGMGAVYLARQASLGNRRVAIKETVIQGATAEDRARAAEQFQKEAEILASLEHPGLVDVKDYFEEQGSQYLVMAFIDGASLEQLCPERSEPPPTGQVVDWILAVADVLTYMHEHEPPVIVRDLKPSNIMLDAKGRVRLIDFGIARVFDAKSETSTFLKGAGTVGYAPLEQHGGGTTDPRSDVYALGATLYRLLTGTLPPGAVAMATGEAALTPPSVINPRVPPELEQVVLRMMGLRKDDRYPSARAAADALREARDSVTSSNRPRVAVAPRFCTQCGATLTAGATACGQCGQPLDPALLGPPSAGGQGPYPGGPSSGGGYAPGPSSGAGYGPSSGSGYAQGPSSGPGYAQGPASGGGYRPPGGNPGYGPPSGPQGGPSGGFVPGSPSGGFQAPTPPTAPPGAGSWQAPSGPGQPAGWPGSSGWQQPPQQPSAPPWNPNAQGASGPGPGPRPSPIPTQLAAIIAIVALLAFGGWYYVSHQPTPISSPSPVPSPTASPTPTPTPSPTQTPTPRPSPTQTPTPRPSPTETDGWHEESLHNGGEGVTGSWKGTLSGNDPQVEARMDLKQSGNNVTGTFDWRSPRTGTCRRTLAGTYDTEAEEYTLHDVDVAGTTANGSRFCEIDEYVLRLNGRRLSGTYESEECKDTGTVNLERLD